MSPRPLSQHTVSSIRGRKAQVWLCLTALGWPATCTCLPGRVAPAGPFSSKPCCCNVHGKPACCCWQWVLLLRQQLTTRACTCAAQPQRRHVAAARQRSRLVGWVAGRVHPSVAVAAFWAAATARHHTHAGRERQHTGHTGRTEAMEHAQASTADTPNCAGAAAGQRVVPATSLDGLVYRLTSLCMSLGFCCSVLQDMHTSQWPAAQQQHNSNAHTHQ